MNVSLPPPPQTVAKESEEREFLESQLQLFGKMCKVRA